jgi:hypothetical protein
MRVIYDVNSTVLPNQSCNLSALVNPHYGETEDYIVNLVCPTTPAAITGRFPADGFNMTCGTANTLKWNKSNCAEGFRVFLGTDNPPMTEVSHQTDNQYYTGSLADNTVYYWRVEPYNGGERWSKPCLVS